MRLRDLFREGGFRVQSSRSLRQRYVQPRLHVWRVQPQLHVRRVQPLLLLLHGQSQPIREGDLGVPRVPGVHVLGERLLVLY